MINLTIYPLESKKKLIDHYHSLSHLPGFALLESNDRNLGQYDLLTAFPYDELKVLRNDPNLHKTFATLEAMLLQDSSPYDFPFQGGAIGFISYDLASELAGVQSMPHPMLVDVPLVHLRFYDWAIITDHKTGETYIIAANRQKETSSIVRNIIKLWHADTSAHSSFSLVRPFIPLIEKKDYEKAFNSIHQDLSWGRAYQVNYTFPFLGEYSGDTWELYKHIRDINPVPYAAYLRHSFADIISFSPERFILSDNGKMLTSPIKGSAPRSPYPEQDQLLKTSLAGSIKNRAENVMIVDLLRNDFGKIAQAGTVKVKNLCSVQSFNSVHHLVSDITADCKENISMIQAFADCFPGGSITGAPKLEAMKIIAEQEVFARGIYCGSIGYFSTHGRFDTNIAIRTITATDSHLYLPAGGGIVMDSSCDGEFEECYTKIKAITHALIKK